jgi:hypothetical protein
MSIIRENLLQVELENVNTDHPPPPTPICCPNLSTTQLMTGTVMTLAMGSLITMNMTM